jgi:hypothetical protein
LVEYGNVRALPLTLVKVTIGADVSTVNDSGPWEPVLLTLSVCVAVTVKLPFASVGEVVYVQVPAVHGTLPFCVPAPPMETLTVALSPVAVPHVPPIDVTAVLDVNGKVRGEPFTVVMATVGATVSTMIVRAGLEPLLPAASVCEAVTTYVPDAESAGDGAKLQLPAVHGAVPFWVAAPVIAMETVGLSPAAVPHAPDTAATVDAVVYGKVRGVPLTLVSVTAGAVVSMMTVCAPLEPVLPPLSVCVAVTAYVPAADKVGEVVYVQVPLLHGAVPFCVAVPVMLTVTVALSPGNVPHAPPNEVTFTFVEYGKVRAAPFTLVTETVGAPVSMMTVCAPLEPELPAASPCVTVIEYEPLAASVGEVV